MSSRRAILFFTTLAAIALAMTIASYWHRFSIAVVRYDRYSLQMDRGVLLGMREHLTDVKYESGRPRAVPVPWPSGKYLEFQLSATRSSWPPVWLGSECTIGGQYPRPVASDGNQVTIEYIPFGVNILAAGMSAWLGAGLLILPALYAFHRLRRQRRVLAEGFCKSCGYDMRATPERCPECGNVP